MNSINKKFRLRRFHVFTSLVEKNKTEKITQILDVGGTEDFWDTMNYPGDENIHITLLNLSAAPVKNTKFTSVKGDACDLSEFKDNQFDIVFSNSVIEHLFTKENQQKMASEVRRVGKNYYIQTPNLYFPIEAHWQFPFYQFLPFKLKVWMTQHLNLGHFKKTKDKQAAITRVNEVQLLTEKEMKILFPEARVFREYFLGLVKSITMYSFQKI